MFPKPTEAFKCSSDLFRGRFYVLETNWEILKSILTFWRPILCSDSKLRDFERSPEFLGADFTF